MCESGCRHYIELNSKEVKSEGNLHINSYFFTFNIKIFKIVKRSLGQDNIIMQSLYCFEFVHLKKNISLEIDTNVLKLDLTVLNQHFPEL